MNLAARRSLGPSCVANYDAPARTSIIEYMNTVACACLCHTHCMCARIKCTMRRYVTRTASKGPYFEASAPMSSTASRDVRVRSMAR